MVIAQCKGVHTPTEIPVLWPTFRILLYSVHLFGDFGRFGQIEGLGYLSDNQPGSAGGGPKCRKLQFSVL